MRRLGLIAAFLLILPLNAHAQPAQAVQGTGTSSTAAGGVLSVNCITGCGGGGGPAANVAVTAPLGSQAVGASVATTVNGALPAGTNLLGKTGIDQTTPGTTNGVAVAPSSAAGVGITPVVSSAAENNHVLKASAGNLYGAYATNLTSTAGYLEIFDATSAPVDGAVTPKACVALPPTGTANISRSPGPPAVFVTGITAVVSSANTCFTKTTGTITAFFSGDVQ